MSRHLFTLAVAASDILDAVERAHARGDALTPILASMEHASRIAYFAEVFDGWSNTAEDLARNATPSWRPLIQRIEGSPYGCTRFEPADFQACQSPLLAHNRKSTKLLNDYAIRMLSLALDTSAGFCASTGLPVIVAHASLGATFCDSDFRKPHA